jgi:hypothetical protein
MLTRKSVFLQTMRVLLGRWKGRHSSMGGIMIAKFDRFSGGFLAPTFNTNGGGNSNVQYDSQSVRRAIGSGQMSLACVNSRKLQAR